MVTVFCPIKRLVQQNIKYVDWRLLQLKRAAQAGSGRGLRAFFLLDRRDQASKRNTARHVRAREVRRLDAAQCLRRRAWRSSARTRLSSMGMSMVVLLLLGRHDHGARRGDDGGLMAVR